MAMSSGIKFRCHPTCEQKHILSQWMGCQRVIYNAKVAEDRYYRTFSRKALSLAGIMPPVDQEYARFKNRESTPYLYEVPPQILRNGATRFMAAYHRFWKGLAGRPVFKSKYQKQGVWLTGELFRFVPTAKSRRKKGKTIYDHDLIIGYGGHSVGKLAFTAHDSYQAPSTITISKTGGKWFLSFSYEKPDAAMPEQDIIRHYAGMGREALDAITCAGDLGVSSPLRMDDGKEYDFTDIQKKRIAHKEKRKKRYQRMMARRKSGSGRRKRASVQASRCSLYASNVRNDFAHKASRTLVNSQSEVFVFEDLRIKNMTKAPKPVKDENGKHLKNGARAKAGLNKAILASAWGKVKLYTAYKARRVNKLVIAVSPHYTSQECSKCSHTQPDNRKDRLFVCQGCGFTENADTNAAINIKRRGIRELVSGGITAKTGKRTMRLRKKVVLGQELAEVTHVGEGHKTDCGNPCGSLPSMIRETPTTTVLTV